MVRLEKLSKANNMKKISINDMNEVHDALNVLYHYKNAKIAEFDFTGIFKKQPTKAQIKHLENATSSNTFVQALIFVPELWAKEFGTELTPEYQKFLKKIRGKQKNQTKKN